MASKQVNEDIAAIRKVTAGPAARVAEIERELAAGLARHDGSALRFRIEELRNADVKPNQISQHAEDIALVEAEYASLTQRRAAVREAFEGPIADAGRQLATATKTAVNERTVPYFARIAEHLHAALDEVDLLKDLERGVDGANIIWERVSRTIEEAAAQAEQISGAAPRSLGSGVEQLRVRRAKRAA